MIKIIKMILLLLLFIIQIKADDQGYCGDYCIYTFIESTKTMIFDGYYNTDNFVLPAKRPWHSYKDKIENIKITGNIYSIGDLTFYGCINLKTIDFGHTVKTIGTNAFNNCTSLKSIVIPDQMLVLDSGAFLGCISLETVVIYSTSLEFSYSVFWGCENLKSVIYYGRSLPLYNPSETCSLTSLGCGNSTHFLSCEPFSCHCDLLTSISVPFDYIGNEFAGMSISKRTEEEDKENIKKGSCGDDCEWKVNTITKYMVISGKGNMIDYKTPEAVPWYNYNEFITYVKIEYGIERIGSYSFYSQQNIQQISFPESLQTIGKNSFSYCSSIQTLTIPTSVKIIEDEAFLSCESVYSIIIFSESITFGKSIFWECSQLHSFYYYGETNPVYLSEETCYNEEIKCGNSTSLINCSPFSCGCKSLQSISVAYNYQSSEFAGQSIIKRTQEEDEQNIRRGTCGNNCQWEFDFGKEQLTFTGNGDITSYQSYQEVPWLPYSIYIKHVVITEGITAIGDYAFFYFTLLENIEIPKSIKFIGFYSMENCHSLTSIKIPSDVYFIGSSTFSNCISLRNVEIYSQIIEIGYSCFWKCPQLSTIEYYGFIEPTYYIQKECYDNGMCGTKESSMSCSPFSCGCDSLITVSVPNNYQSNSFCGKDISKRNDNVTTIINGECGSNCHWKFNLIDEILTIYGNGDIPNYKSSHEVPWVSYYSNVRKVIIEEGILSIGDYSFSSFEMIETVEIPETVQSIGFNVFSFCTSLTHLTLPFSLTFIDAFTFLNCDSLKKVVILSQSLKMRQGIFWKCSQLSTIEYYGINEPIYDNSQTCNSETCGIEGMLLSCSPFSCDCNSLVNVSVPLNIHQNISAIFQLLEEKKQIKQFLEIVVMTVLGYLIEN